MANECLSVFHFKRQEKNGLLRHPAEVLNTVASLQQQQSCSWVPHVVLALLQDGVHLSPWETSALRLFQETCVCLGHGFEIDPWYTEM